MTNTIIRGVVFFMKRGVVIEMRCSWTACCREHLVVCRPDITRHWLSVTSRSRHGSSLFAMLAWLQNNETLLAASSKPGSKWVSRNHFCRLTVGPTHLITSASVELTQTRHSHLTFPPPPCGGSLTPKRGEDTSGTRVCPHAKFGVNLPAGCREIVDKKANKKTYSKTKTSPFALTSEWRAVIYSIVKYPVT